MPGELIPIVMFISMAAVAILRPLTKRIGLLIERSYEERRADQGPQIERMTRVMETLIDRLDRLEDRVDFTERMLESQRAQSALGRGPASRERTRSGPPGDASPPDCG